jgi:epoxyqueuosine reductase
MNLGALEQAARDRGLSVLGGLHPRADEAGGAGTLLLLGPDEPAFWPLFAASTEYADGRPDPMDRWSKRVIGGWAETIGAAAFFPSDGPPYPPFIDWALRSGRIHMSPVRLMVHDRAGLWVSFRGALALPDRIELPAPPPPPCLTCAGQPCRTACPVDAFGPASYDVPACKAHITGPDSAGCMAGGCAVRRVCPVGQRFGRLEAQSAFQMKAFL